LQAVVVLQLGPVLTPTGRAGQGGAGEEVFGVAAEAVVVEVLVGQAQVGKVAPAKGGAIHQNPEGQQFKALDHQQQGRA